MATETGHVLSLFYKISRMIHTFLPAPYKLKDPAVVEICFSTSQPATHGFVDCVIILAVLAFHVIFKAQNRQQSEGLEALTAFLCNCFQCEILHYHVEG
jgi:hypothetical protein